MLAPATRLLAQTGTADGTYHWGGVSPTANSGGTGFKTQGDKFVVSNIMINDANAARTTEMYANNATDGASQTVYLNAQNGAVMKTFTLKNMGLRNFSTLFYLNYFTITLYDYFGVQIASHTLTHYNIPNTTTQLTSFPFTIPWPAAGYDKVASIKVDYQYEDPTKRPYQLVFMDITLANISATTPAGTTVGTLSGSTFCAGSAISIPFTAAGYGAANTYTAQLSNSAGSFASPATIGTLAGNATSGSINGTIPAGTASGTGYRVRIVGSAPNTSPASNSDNGSNLTINAKPSASISAFTNVSCFNGNNGSATVSASGGTPSYTYSWSPSGGSGATASSLTAGTYTVTVSDSKGCQATASQTITQPASALTASAVVTNVSCFGGNNGAVDLTASGGTAPYTYNWGGGNSSEDRTNLTAGTYGVTVTDNKGCTFTIFPISVTQPSAPVSGTTVVTNVACFGGNTGAINLTPAGGNGGYTFLWNGGATTEDRTSLTAGTYSVTITDSKSCQATVSNIQVGQPSSAVSGSTIVTNVSCFGGNTGSIDLTPAGGTPGYTYLWNGGATTEDRTSLTAGTYSVTITDANNCQATVSNIVVGQPSAAVSASTLVTNVSCFGGNTGSIDLTPTGGTPGYTFLWNGGATSEDRSNLTAGNYSVTITDAKGCQATINNIQISQPTSPVSGTTVVTNVACFGGNTGAINLTPSGGTGGYTFLWNNGATTKDRTGLTAGSYSVTITDANGCEATISNIQVSQPATAVSGSTIITNVSCFGGSNGAINLTPTGGTPGYTFLWNGGATTEDRTGLSAGTYSVTITDANGCTATVSGIEVSQPEPVSATIAYGGSPYFTGSGTAAVTFSGTTGGTYASTTGLVVDGSTGTIDLATSTPGTYTVTYTIANATCGDYQTTAPVTLINPFSATISYGGSPYCDAMGTATVTRTGTAGGTYSATPAGLSINASTGAIDLAASAAGTYTVRYGTTPSDFTTTQVAVRPATLINPSPNTVYCSGATTSPVQLTGAAGLSFSWTASNPSIGIPASGTSGIPAFTATNPGNTLTQSYVEVTAQGGTGCDLTRTMIFRYSVNPTPVLSTVASQQLCAGSVSSPVQFTSTVSGTTVGWTSNNPSIGLNASGTGDIPSFTTLNNTGAVQTATLTAIPVAKTCTGNAVSFTIAVSPSAGTLSYEGSPYCQSGPAYPARTGSAGGVFSASPAGLDLNAATGQVNLALSQPGTYTVTYTVGASGSCSPAASAQLTILPQASAGLLPNLEYCNSVAVPAMPIPGNGSSYTWTNDNPSIGLPASGSGTSLPAFTTVNAGPATQYAYVKITPLGNGSTLCPSKPVAFRIAVKYCGPVAQSSGGGGDAGTLRTALQQQFEAGPNPARNTVVLRYSGTEQGPFTVQLVSQYGQPVGRTFSFTGNSYTLDLTNVTPGAYSLQVTHVKSGVQFTKQVIKL